ncbi:MAG: tRNA uridine-5-carboxymethylaminomethyl(34) synthesis GTPase MnmE [Puniceicoccales bacterium]|jgi:tRNA modification GTPase|nr:tRNA uridine-5-carboxymethylaminomethyl(34) synthesis GTPase MnmE [Puniceicoccales bacterium]
MNDTIAALATPQGESAIAVVRISGDRSLALLGNVFAEKNISARVIYHGNYLSNLGEVLDEVLFVFFRGKSSYTGEDSAEIYTHGNMLIVTKILEDLCKRGCRVADRGEFTKRAFLNGKLDLCQAEAVADIIHASSEAALAVARRQLSGKLSEKLHVLNNELMEVLALLETHIDFVEEEIEGNELGGTVAKRMDELISAIDLLLDGGRYRSVLSGGLNTAIIGAPNAGKSSLLNCLLNAERALVSPIAGTTRDFITEKIMIGGHVVNLFDTAGLRRDADSELELRGMEKSIEQIQLADAYLLVIDSNADQSALDDKVLSLLGEDNCLVLENKSDLLPSRSWGDFLPRCEHGRISILNEPERTRLLVANFLAKRCFLPAEVDIVVNGRHIDILTRAKQAIDQTRKTLPTIGVEFSANNLRDALEILGEMTERYDNESMLDKLFSTFCVGK